MLAMTALSAPIPSPQAQTDAATPSTTTIAAEKPKSILEGRSSAPAPRDAGPVDRIMAWIQRQQRALNSRLTQSVRALKKESSVAAALLLIGVSFLYGVLHAAGPGHGKAIIAAYALAEPKALRRGIALSFLAGIFQAISAIAIVGVLAIALGATGRGIQSASATLESASYALIAVIGAALLWRALAEARLLPAWANGRRRHAHEPAHHADHADHQHGHHAHGQGDACATSGHAHLPAPAALERDWSLRKALALALAIGIRPCSGAIIVLIFALGQGMLAAGIGATFAMAIGTAMTTSALAALAVGARAMAIRAPGRGGAWAGRVETAVGVGGAALVLGLGMVLFAASLGPRTPF